MAYWLGTTPSVGAKEHAVTYLLVEEGHFTDNHDEELKITLCGILNPIEWSFLWDSRSELACKRCVRKYRQILDSRPRRK